MILYLRMMTLLHENACGMKLTKEQTKHYLAVALGHYHGYIKQLNFLLSGKSYGEMLVPHATIDNLVIWSWDGNEKIITFETDNNYYYFRYATS